jgi:hypothetical protein
MWKQIKVTFENDQQLSSEGFNSSLLVESLFTPSHIYFAHYGGQSMLSIVINTEVDNNTIIDILKKELQYTICVTIDNCSDPGSFIHALGYQICKQLRELDKITIQQSLGDLFHWMQNMLGYTYPEEALNHIQWAKNAHKNYQRSASR